MIPLPGRSLLHPQRLPHRWLVFIPFKTCRKSSRASVLVVSFFFWIIEVVPLEPGIPKNPRSEIGCNTGPLIQVMGTQMADNIVACPSVQRGEERTWARAAGAQEGDHPQPAVCRRHRPGRTGQHALPGLLQRQKQTAERPALGRVSDWRGEMREGGVRRKIEEIGETLQRQKEE